MGTLGKKDLLQKRERICPLCDEVIAVHELVGRTKYHEVCAAMLKRIKDITRLRYNFFINKSALMLPSPLTERERQIRFMQILKETEDKVNKWADNPTWLIGCVLDYYWRTFKHEHNGKIELRNRK